MNVDDPEVAARLRSAFEDDLKHSVERTYEEWSSRSFWHKLVDGVTYLANEQM